MCKSIQLLSEGKALLKCTPSLFTTSLHHLYFAKKHNHSFLTKLFALQARIFVCHIFSTTFISQLLKILNSLVDQGSTVIVIEHNLDVISQADWIVDLGPLTGQNGGNIMFEGTPKDLLNCTSSITGQYLKEYIK